MSFIAWRQLDIKRLLVAQDETWFGVEAFA